ncbi:hypothetical protein Syun_028654 [Stephania yunnanensis]|uniref:Uncharacterized protein n=1 Tax=Stephania yunnanensis TaxID=152371 RepID=A0AAP0E477_9MAGN
MEIRYAPMEPIWSSRKGSVGVERRDRWEKTAECAGNEKLQEMRDKKPDLFLVSVLKFSEIEESSESDPLISDIVNSRVSKVHRSGSGIG